MGSYALGTWTTSARQDRGLARLFNKQNRALIEARISAGLIINAGGTGYAVGQILTLVDSGTTTTAAQFTITTVSSGAVTGVALVDAGPNTGGVYVTHQATNNHTTTVAPSGGTGCVLNINFYADIIDMVMHGGGILDQAATAYRRQFEDEVVALINVALAAATDTQLANTAASLGVIIPA